MDIKINHPDKKRLYVTQVYNDPMAGELICLTFPFNVLQPVRWRGQTTIQGLPQGPITITFDLPKSFTLDEAIVEFAPCAEAAIKETLEQMKSNAVRSAIMLPGGGRQ